MMTAKKRQATSTGGSKPKLKAACGKLPQAADTPKSRDKLGKIAGVSGKTYERAKAVVDAAISDPAKRSRWLTVVCYLIRTHVSPT